MYVENKDIIPDHFISILKYLKTDWNDILIHRDVIDFESSRASKTTKDISDEINKILNYEEKNHYGQVQSSFYEKEEAEKSLLDIYESFFNGKPYFVSIEII